MKLKSIATLFAIFSLSLLSQIQTSFAKELPSSIFSPPAEWEQQESIWLAWPQYEPIAKHSNIPQVLDIIEAVTPGEYVDLIVNNRKEALLAQTKLNERGIASERVRLHYIKHTDFWMRDTGAVFIRNNQEPKPDLYRMWK